MSYLSTLKKSSSLDLDHLAKVIDGQNNPQKKTFEREDEDERFWKPERDKAGNAFAVIRFLPPAIVNGEPEDVLWVQTFSHGFQNPQTGKWYIEKSLTTINQKDPVSEFNSILWNSSQDDNSPARKQARAQKRRLQYVSNILVKDPKNPQNEGKVFLYKYGKKVFDKIQAIMFPKIPGAPQVNPFDPEKGANFNLFIEQVMGYPNYDQSRFDAPSSMGDETSIEAICSQAYSLKALVDPSNFKTRDKLEERLSEVLGFDVVAYINSHKTGAAPVAAVNAPVAATNYVPSTPPTVEASVADDDADLEEFKRLAVG